MFQNNIASKRVVDTPHRKNVRFDLHHTVATTMPFGFCQPIHTFKMIPNSRHTVSVKSLVRATPMVAPTSSGRVTLKLWNKFVGMSDLFRNHASFLTAQPVAQASGLKTMTKLPCISHKDLSMLVLIGCKFSIYRRITAGTGSVPSTYGLAKTQSEVLSIVNYVSSSIAIDTPMRSSVGAGSLFTSRFGDYVSQGNYVFNVNLLSSSYPDLYLPTANKNSLTASAFNYDIGLNNYVDIGNCDYVFEREINEGGGLGTYAIAVDLSDYGKRLQSILVGLGLGVDFGSTKIVDLSRLLAYYKAYWDTFGLCQYMNWESTNCSLFCRKYENGDAGFNPLNLWSADPIVQTFVAFINDVAATYVTDQVDYISAHRKTDAVGVSDLGFLEHIVVASPNANNPYGAFGQDANPEVMPANIKTTTNAIFINQVTHTQVDADLLKVLAKSINLQTVAGRRLVELLRAAGQGAYIDNMHSSFIGMTEVDMDVSDINATADGTNSVTGNNSVLGETVGKGVGFNSKWHKDSFTYETDEFGYWITLCACVTDSGYCQGVDTTIYDVDRFGQYRQDFDGLGYELTPKSVLVSGADWNIDGEHGSDDSFGLIPRFTRYKFSRNVLNGDFRRRSRRSAFLPFTLDKFIQVNDGYVSQVDDTPAQYLAFVVRKTSRISDLPIAGNAWRFLNRYPWLCNFERIFTFFKPERTLDYNNNSDIARYFYCAQTEDNIMYFALVNDDASAPMLPVADSFGTTDDNDGKGIAMSQA